MKFMMIVELTHADELRPPRPEDLATMGEFNDELREAGVLLAVDGLHPSAGGARVTFQNGSASVTDGPFTETKELISGFWIIDVASREEAIAWARRVPFKNGIVEVRRVAEGGDMGYDVPDLMERAETLLEARRKTRKK